MNFLIWIGAFVGLASGGWKGLLIGAAVGYIISRYLPPLLIGAAAGKLGQIQAQFLDSTFAVMGAMCKADGQITQNEIEVAEALFERLRLSADTRESAIASFNRGKADGFDVDAEVAKFAQASRGQRVLHQMFIQVQMSALAAGVGFVSRRRGVSRTCRWNDSTPTDARVPPAVMRFTEPASPVSSGVRMLKSPPV